MSREPRPQPHRFARAWRSAVHLLVPVLFLGLTAAAGTDKAEEEKAAAPVEIRLTEYAIEMPRALPAGPTTFHVRNQGGKSHSFKIEGPGIDVILKDLVRPRDTATLEVVLVPGEYRIYCPMGNHAMKGMSLTLVVGEKQGG